MSTRTLLLLLAAGLIGGGFLYIMSKESANRTSRESDPVRIVAFGDSLTEGYGVGINETYPYFLERALSAKHSVTVINQGISGDTTYDATQRVSSVLDEKPDIVLLGIGGNDALRVMSAKNAKDNIETIIKALQAAQKPPRIVLLQMQAGVNGGFDYKKQFDMIYPELADAYHIPLVPFVVTSVYLDPAYMLPDRVHMNAAGYKYVVDHYLKDAVEKEIQQLK